MDELKELGEGMLFDGKKYVKVKVVGKVGKLSE